MEEKRIDDYRHRCLSHMTKWVRAEIKNNAHRLSDDEFMEVLRWTVDNVPLQPRNKPGQGRPRTNRDVPGDSLVVREDLFGK